MARSFTHWAISATGPAASRRTTAITASTRSTLSTHGASVGDRRSPPQHPRSVGSRPARQQPRSQQQSDIHTAQPGCLSYKLAAGPTAYAGYSEANRGPTPLELACANRAKPCLLESFLVADPPLKQVVAHTYEAGLRDNRPFFGGNLEGKAGLFRTDTTDDIINLASLIAGRGFFQNVPGSRRQGLETSLRYQSSQWSAYAAYSLVDATYRFTGALSSPNNPFADENGNVHVVPGKRIPGIPMHQAKFGIDFRPRPEWTLGADAIAVGSRYFLGDDANQNPRLPGYWLLNLRAAYQPIK